MWLSNWLYTSFGDWNLSCWGCCFDTIFDRRPSLEGSCFFKPEFTGKSENKNFKFRPENLKTTKLLKKIRLYTASTPKKKLTMQSIKILNSHSIKLKSRVYRFFKNLRKKGLKSCVGVTRDHFQNVLICVVILSFFKTSDKFFSSGI